MSEVILYTKVGCGQCIGAKMFMQQNNIPVSVRDIGDPVIREEFDQYGFGSLPVIVLPNGEAFSGFQVDKLKALKESL